jgi:anthranilate synthase component I
MEIDRMEPLVIDAAALDRLRGSWDVVPVVRTFRCDSITPVAAFAAVEHLGDESFLLESVERGENVGRYSFIGVRPRRRLTFSPSDRPLDLLRAELEPLRVFDPFAGSNTPDVLPPFAGGAVGYFGYGAARWSERLPDRHAGGSEIDAALLFFDQVIAFDHVRQQLFVVSNVLTRDERSSAALIDEAHRNLDAIAGALAQAAAALSPVERNAPPCEFETALSRDRFLAAVAEAKELIAAGEIFQVVLSQRWSCDFPADGALELYRALRALNPSPYMFLLRTRERTLVGASPEMLVRCRSGIAESRPIAGTRPRGASSQDDRRLELELLADPKENAEHLMLVDLARNDLGRVCAAGSVEIAAFRRVERYSHVMHMVTDVAGRLSEGCAAIDLFFASFPAGTVTGAPKIRAMEIVDALEPVRRGSYAGAVAYFGFSGTLDSCISIRTIVLEEGRAHVQAGAGIVHDSDPGREYEESLSKSAALRSALAAARSSLGRSLRSSPQPQADRGLHACS